MLVKVCGMTIAEQIGLLQGADFFGLIFAERSPRNAFGLQPDKLNDIPIPSVGVFVDEAPSRILQLATHYKFDIVQLHGSESPEMCRQLAENSLKVWKSVPISTMDDLKKIKAYIGIVDAIVLDAKTTGDTPYDGGTGRKFDWSVISHYDYETPFIVAGGVGPNDVEDLRNITNPHMLGVDINSRFELSPGNKDIISVNKFIKEIKR